jgi:hypothetical protein
LLGFLRIKVRVNLAFLKDCIISISSFGLVKNWGSGGLVLGILLQVLVGECPGILIP